MNKISSPAVAFLASEASDWCNGQVISARGYEIGLYNKPQIISQVVSAGPWDLDNAFEQGSDEIRLKDGRTLERFSAVIRGGDGTQYGRVWFFHDVTRLTNAEEAW